MKKQVEDEKTTAEQPPKKKFRVIGLDRRKSTFARYGAQLEDALNKIHDEGYTIKVFNIEGKGTIVMGTLETEEEQAERTGFPGMPFVIMPRPQGMPSIPGIPDGAAFKSKHTMAVIARVHNDVTRVMADEPKKKQTIEDLAAQLLKELDIPEATVVLEDLELAANNHAKQHEEGSGHDGCETPDILRSFVSSVKEKMKARLQ